MEIDVISSLISDIGFPITVSIAAYVFINRQFQQSKEISKSFENTILKFTDLLQGFKMSFAALSENLISLTKQLEKLSDTDEKRLSHHRQVQQELQTLAKIIGKQSKNNITTQQISDIITKIIGINGTNGKLN